MKTLTVDGRKVEINGEKNLLEVIRKAGIDLPTFCYHSELSVYGACRMCLVELEDGRIVASCSTPPQEGMVVRTTTPRVQKIRRMALELLLANHDRECTTCEKSGSCKLQDLAQRFGIDEVRFGARDEKLPLDKSSVAIIRNPNKCILCGDCVRMCQEVQGIGVLDFAHRGAKMVVTPAFGKDLAEVDCVSCGQCAAVCPTGALTINSSVPKAWEYLHDESKTVIAQIAPAVRVAIGELFGLPTGDQSLGKLVTALRRLGFDKVFDTCFAADLTVMEETSELLGRVQEGEKLPQFTSCCPAWVKYAEQFHQELLPNLSSCRSPQQMFGSLAKKYYSKELGVDPEDLIVVSIMPCTAKKFEAGREEFTTDGRPDVDLVLTTQETAQMIKQAGLVFSELEDDSLDMPFGFTSGAGVIFGVTGGVAEAALRSAHYLATGKELDDVNFTAVRGMDKVKAAEVDIDGNKVRVAIVHGLGSVEEVIKKVQAGELSFDLIEVMACPGGCIGGAGQPQAVDGRVRQARATGLYTADKAQQLRRAHDNPLVRKVYDQWLQNPNSEEAHKALHTAYASRRRIKGNGITLHSGKASDGEKLKVSVCVGTCCYLKGSYDVLQELGRRARQAGIEDRIDLNATFCFENCSEAANVQIGDKLYGGITIEKVGDLFNQILAELEGKTEKRGA